MKTEMDARRKATLGLSAAALALYALHQDSWLWGNPTLVFGMFPIGLLYHVLYCVAASGLMLALTRLAWPENLETARSAGEGDPSWR